jgi:outer membrane receptor protein involved in Fe transport
MRAARAFLRICATALCSGFAAAAGAQTPPPAAPVEVEEIVVTGSRIASPNAASASPIQVLSSQDIQASGKTDLSDILYQLPQMLNNDLGQDFSNRTTGLTTAGGLTTADLRGLGPNRTLVLIDGKRLGQGSPQTTIASPAPDLDQIPAIMVERIEVLTGGASSVYGSDAIGGVVNFILKRNFQGLLVDGQYGADWHDNRSAYMKPLLNTAGVTPLSGEKWDGKNSNLSILAGTNFAEGKGNFTGYFTYYHFDPVASSERDIGQCQLTEVTDAAGNVIGSRCFGSSNSNRYTPLSGPNASHRFAVVGNQFVPWTGSFTTNPSELFNSQPFIYMQRNDDRYLAGFNAHDDLADYAKPYFELSLMNDKTHQNIAPSAAFTTNNPNTGGPYFVNCGNPLLSAQQISILGCTPGQISAANQADRANQVPITIGRRNVEGGGRSSDYEHTNYRAAVGMKGEFLDAWNYDAYGQYYYVTYRNAQNNYLSYQKIDNALLATGTAANPQCLVGKPCVPWNIFTTGAVTPDQVNYLYLPGTTSGNNTLRTLHADITGDLGKYGLKLPTAHEGFGVNVGFEHRNEAVFYQPDDATNSGQLSGAGGTQEPLNASIGVNEGFIEVRMPLLQDLPFSRDLVIGGGFRHSNYSVSGGVNTYKFDLQFAPIRDIRFRGSYQRAIRTPTVSEFYNPQNLGLIAYGDDPCAAPTGGGPALSTLANCLNSLKSLNPTAAQIAAFTRAYGNGTTTDIIPQAVSGQLGQVQGGNPLLTPEKAKSYSAGFLFTPSVVPNLSGSVDFWQIRVDGEVGAYPATVLVQNCLATGNPIYCAGVVRTSTDFSLQGAAVATGGYIVQTNQNIASALASGIDLQFNYKHGLGRWGTLAWGFNGSYFIHNTTTPLPGGGSYDCAGLFGTTCQTVSPRWRHNLRTTWQTPGAGLDVSLAWRFIGKVGYDNNDPNPLLAGAEYSGGYDFAVAQVPNVSYLDLHVAWHATNSLDVRGGIDNLFDRNPPIVTNPSLQGGGQANTFATYDVLGRQLYIAATMRF